MVFSQEQCSPKGHVTMSEDILVVTLGGMLLVPESESESENQSCLLVTLWTIQSMEFSRPEYWNGYPLSSPGDLPKLGIEPRSPALQADSLPAEPQENKDAPHHPAMQRTAPLQ